MPDPKTFGNHVRSLRKPRRMTQELLAERSGLSPDTIRRIEHGSFSPSLTTIRKLCRGFGLELSTFFEAAELGARDRQHELRDLLGTRSDRDLDAGIRVLEVLFEEIDAAVAERERKGKGEDDGEPGESAP
jgi:transcriptional regulator with XRE-family HTH domain